MPTRSSYLYDWIGDGVERRVEVDALFACAVDLPAWGAARDMCKTYADEIRAELAAHGLADPSPAEMDRFAAAVAWELYDSELDAIEREANISTRLMMHEHCTAGRETDTMRTALALTRARMPRTVAR